MIKVYSQYPMIKPQTFIYSKNALREAIFNNPNAVEKIFLMPQFADGELMNEIKKNNVPYLTLPAGKVPNGVDLASIRGGIFGLLSSEGLVKSYKAFSENLVAGDHTALILLDEIQDPHNVGAIIRSAAAFGISGILIPEHNQARVTDTVIKVSAGMAFRVPLVAIGNVNTTVRDLKEKGFWIYGLDETATHSTASEKFDAPAVFVMGNEANGIRQKTRELCDVLLAIPMNKRCESLNVAASTAVVLYSWGLQHPEALE